MLREKEGDLWKEREYTRGLKEVRYFMNVISETGVCDSKMCLFLASFYAVIRFENLVPKTQKKLSAAPTYEVLYFKVLFLIHSNVDFLFRAIFQKGPIRFKQNPF